MPRRPATTSRGPPGSSTPTPFSGRLRVAHDRFGGAPILMPALTPLSPISTLAGVYRTPAVSTYVTAVYTTTNPMREPIAGGPPRWLTSSTDGHLAAVTRINPSNAAAQHDPPERCRQIGPHLTYLTIAASSRWPRIGAETPRRLLHRFEHRRAKRAERR